jgi:hypothetical protein
MRPDPRLTRDGRWLSWRREPPVPGETGREARARIERNRQARIAWNRASNQRCAKCGHTRFNVLHETDPATSAEGPYYFADFLDELHPFVLGGSDDA